MVNLSNITFRYAGQKVPVFQDFSMQLNEARIYGLLGKNGTGKSTLLYLIAGLLRPQEGRVTIDGNDAMQRSTAMLQELFIVPEEFVLPDITLDEYVRLNAPFYPHFSREVLARCLDSFELSSALHLHALSMGEKKKVYMSFALAAGTRLLLMDEPTNGLDIPSKSQFRKVITENMTPDRTLVISTHQVHDIESLLDHLLILSKSSLLLNMSMAELTEHYAFELRSPGQMGDDVIYAEPSLMGNMVMTRRSEGNQETQVNLELLFNAVTKGLLR